MELRRHVLLSEVEGKPAICFDTGLEPRAFARTKMSQSMIEKGCIVNSDGSHEAWMSSGVCEHDGHMRVWGKPFNGERLDFILDNVSGADSAQTINALKALNAWIKAKLALGDTHSALNPSAVFVSEGGSVFFAPPNLANRCLYIEGIELDYYNCPDLIGINAAAFCAAVMLYKIFTKTLPYAGKETIFQDMREGIFLPLHLAAPEVNKELCGLVQAALYLPAEKKKFASANNRDGRDILNKMQNILEEALLQQASLYRQLPNEEIKNTEAGKKAYFIKYNLFIKTKRFAVRNKVFLTGISIAMAFVLFFVITTIDGARNRPTTAGMLSNQVVNAYYNAYSSLDHLFMEACAQGSDPIIKNDITAAATFFAIEKTRQAYEISGSMLIIPAQEWLDAGKELPAPDVFGVTGFVLEHLAGSEDSDAIVYRANYLLWAPDEYARRRTDTLALERDRKGNWRITEIIRTER